MVKPLRSARLLLALALLSPASAVAADVGLTSFYPSDSAQQAKVNVLNSLGFTVAVPLKASAFADPSKLGDGGFTQADLDFTSAIPTTPGTATRVSLKARSGPQVGRFGCMPWLPACRWRKLPDRRQEDDDHVLQ